MEDSHYEARDQSALAEDGGRCGCVWTLNETGPIVQKASMTRNARFIWTYFSRKLRLGFDTKTDELKFQLRTKHEPHHQHHIRDTTQC